MVGTLTGKWEEIKEHDAELAGRTVTLTVMPEATDPPTPNLSLIEALREAEDLEQGITSTGDAVEILRKGRSGDLYGYLE
jgi:hypothetical protein